MPTLDLICTARRSQPKKIRIILYHFTTQVGELSLHCALFSEDKQSDARICCISASTFPSQTFLQISQAGTPLRWWLHSLHTYPEMQMSKDLLVYPQPYTGTPDQSWTSSVTQERTQRQFTSAERSCQFWPRLPLEDHSHTLSRFLIDLLQGAGYPLQIHHKVNTAGCISDP